MSKPTTRVTCSVCGKQLRGTLTPHGYRVVAHALGTSKDKPAWALPRCPGARREDHQPKK